MYKVLLLTALLVPVPLTSYAPELEGLTQFTGNELLEKCESGNTADINVCRAYIVGARDGGIIAGDKTFETPSDSDAKQLADVVVKYLKNNPENRHLQAGILVMKALRKAFPK